ncbi:thioredoxin-like protein [Ascodesmis nigricans]|uniref:Thioredoxin-like protein n=1 Tax=Ascodesmis nigricans TaxID=341454 RepID=A0A4S2N159_9PEZI|nr:thioredoxin-like protein [Ascodesmis nigricans]
MTHFNIDITSDTVCPWCYISHTRLRRAIAQHTLTHPSDTFTLTYHPFQLSPTAPSPSEPKSALYHRLFGPARTQLAQSRLTTLGAIEGIAFKFGGLTGNTRDSHRLVQLGKVEGGRDGMVRVVERLFGAYFEEERDIADVGVLVEVGVEAGLERGVVREWLESGGGGEVVDGEVEEARRRGVTGVPRVKVNGGWEVEGAGEVGEFLRVFEKVKEAEK